MIRLLFLFGDCVKSKFLSSAFLLLMTSVIVKVIGAVYKIPLTSYIGAVGRGYYATAYNLYLPFHALIMGAFPVALSKITGKYYAKDDIESLVLIKSAADKLFLNVGLIGMAVILLISRLYCNLIASSPKSFLSVIVLAPSILFSALASSYRGYYEGFMNMKPTSFSQLIEALFKMVFGLVFAKLSMAYLYNSYVNSGIVLGRHIISEEEAFAFIYPITSAAAILGVTFGCFLSYIYVLIYHRINKPENSIRIRHKTKAFQKELLSFSFPIMVSCAVQSIFQFLDTASVQWALSLINSDDLKSIYSQSLSAANTSVNDIGAYVFGVLSSAADFKNLVPGTTMALGVCAVPAVSAVYETDDKEHLSSLINSIIKYTFIISAVGGGLIALSSKEILSIFYASSAPDIVVSCETLIKYFALTVPVYSLAGTAVFCVQATGNAKKSILPYVFSGIIRVILNILLVSNESFVLFGCVISGAVGYYIMFIWNCCILNKECDLKVEKTRALIKPLLIGILSYFVAYFSLKYLNFFSSLFINLLIKSGVFCTFFCMLCFLLKVLNFESIFCLLKTKKNGLNT